MSHGLDPNQDRRFVGPDQGPNCLKMLSVDTKGDAHKERSIEQGQLVALL